MIKNELHLAFDSQVRGTFKLPDNHQVLPLGSDIKQERPVIYAMIHCGERGETLTNSQYIRILDVMETYVRDDWADNEAWEEADTMANEIDNLSPVDILRDWKGRLKGRGYSEWHDGFDHPRRYLSKDSHRNIVMDFIVGLKARLSHIPVEKDDAPLNFSLTYIGWTRLEYQRRSDHWNHNGSASQLK